jgi:Ca2+-binding RTX toxin-like protein
MFFQNSHMKYFDVEPLELRTLLSAAFDLIGVTALRNDPNFSGIDGSGVAVAVIDTGLDKNHPLIAANYLAGADLVNGGDNPTVVNPHGTHVAGIIGAKPDASRGFDGGVAPGVGLIGLNVFSQGSGGEVTADNRSIEKALQWVISNYKTYHIVAVNMSLGSGFYTSPDDVDGVVYADEIQELQDDGVTIVSAAGNSYGLVQDSGSGKTRNVEFPNSGAPGIISTLDVGAVWDKNEGDDFIWGSGSVDLTTGADRITSFSQRPPPPVGNGIFAPGAIITSTWPGNQLQQAQGTSQASPMVTGAVALLQDAAETFGGRLLSPEQIRQILLSNGDTVNDGDNEDDAVWVDSNDDGQVQDAELQSLTNTGLNYPRLNVYRALRSVRDLFLGTSSSSDPNGTIGGAIIGPTLSGDPVDPIRGSLGPDGGRKIGDKDIDMYELIVNSPGEVTIRLGSDPVDPADFDSYLRLFDSAGAQLAKDDNNGPGNFSQIKIALATGIYYVGVSGAGNTAYNPTTNANAKSGATGNFSISFSLNNADPNGLISGAVNVNLIAASEDPQVFGGFIGADFGQPVGVSDVDLFKMVVPDNGKLLVNVDTPDSSGYVDSYLRVFNSAAAALGASNNDTARDAMGNATETTDGTFDYSTQTSDVVGHATDSFSSVSVTRGQVVYFGVSDQINRTYDPRTLDGRVPGGTGGLYTLTVTFANNDQNGSIAQASARAIPTTNLLGSIGSDSGQDVGDRDVDMFRLNPTSDGILEFRVDSYSLSGNSSPADTVLKLFDPSGALLASSDDVNGPDPLLQIALPKNRTYYLAVTGKGNENFDPQVLGSGTPGATGNYQLNIRKLSLSAAATLSDDQLGAGALAGISLGQRLIGTLGMDRGFVRGSTDVDLYRYKPSRTTYVELRASSSDSFGADTVLRLFDSTGNELAFNDNAATDTVNSRLQVHVTAGQTYYIGVSGASESPQSYQPATGMGSVSGSTGGYTLVLDGGFARLAGGILSVSGTDGNDTIEASRKNGKVKAVRNGATLSFKGTQSSASIDAGAGADTVIVGAGLVGVYVLGGDGNDQLIGGEADDNLVGGAGKNTLVGNGGDDRLSGSGAPDNLRGGDGSDRLYGGVGDDVLDGGGGVDRLYGAAGNDLLIGGGSNDKLYGEDGNDTLFGNAGDDLLNGGSGTNTLNQ